jgi:hypothetical protein
MDNLSKLVSDFAERVVVSTTRDAETMSETPYFHVIIPVGSDPDAASKRALIKRVATQHGIQARFPDYRPHSSIFDLQGYTRELKSAEFVLVDLSGERPSCYYELGIAEALGCSVVLIARTDTPIHQSANRRDVHYYSDFNELANLLGHMLANRHT